MSLASTHSREHGRLVGMACETDPSRRTGRAARVVGTALIVLACLLSTFGVSVDTATAAPGLVWGSVSEVGPPASSPGGKTRMQLTEVSCPAAGDCVAIGTLEPEHELQALVVEETNGVWGQAAFVELPKASEITHSQLESIACPAVGECTAVGYDENEAGLTQAIVVSESGGGWGTAQVVQQPAVSAYATLASVACTGPGSCVAVGESEYTAGKREAVAVAQTNGTWETAVAVPLPADAAPNGGLDSVSCPAAGECEATGWYQSETAHSDEAMGANDVNGTWTSEGIALPSKGEYVRLYLSCPASGSCGASGLYYESFPTSVAITASYADEKWSSSVQPIDSGAGYEGPYLGMPSCPASGSCVAVGGVHASAEKEYEPLVVSATAGAWGSGGTVSLPSDALTEAEAQTLHEERDGELYGVSCWAVGACEAVGGFVDQNGEFDPMAVSETGGVWGQAEEVAPPSNTATSHGEAWLNSVSCVASEVCGGAGSYDDGAGEFRGMTASAERAPQVTSPTPLAGPAGTPSPPPVKGGPAPIEAPTIAILSSTPKAKKSKVQVKLACGGSACKGIVKIVAATKIRVRRKGKTVTEKRSVLLASGGYEIAAGRTETVEIQLTAKGRALLAKLAKHHVLHVKLTVTVAGGAAKNKAVKLG